MKATRWMHGNRDDLMELCRKYADKAPKHVVFKEPYLPYVPENWNGLLVLGVARNLSESTYPDDVRILKEMTPEKRYENLYLDGDTPKLVFWYNGSIRLALKSLSRVVDCDATASSNAVPWSHVKDGKDQKPDLQMQALAVDFWKELFSTWELPKHIIALGNISSEIMTAAGAAHLKLMLPVRRNLNTRFSGKNIGAICENNPKLAAALDEPEFEGLSPQVIAYSAYAAATLEGYLTGVD